MITIAPDTIAAVASIITLLALIAGGIFWLGQLTNRVGQLENRIDDLDDKIDQLADNLREEMRELREEMRAQRVELLEEMRRGNQQLLIALANHGHDDGGQPVFRVPVGAE